MNEKANENQASGERESVIRIPSSPIMQFAAVGLLAMLGGGAGGVVGLGSSSATVTAKLDAIQKAQESAAEEAKALGKNLNDLRSELAVIQAGKLDERVRELEREVAQLQVKGSNK